MSSPTVNKGYTYAAHGGSVGSWDTQLNGNIEYQDLNLGGYYPITATSTTAAVTFNSSNATIPSTAQSITFPTSNAQNLFYNLTGAITSSLAINMPAVGSIYVFGNSVSSGVVAVQPTGGSAITLPTSGQTVVVTTSTAAFFAQNAFGAINAISVATSSGITTTGPLTQNSSQYEQLASGPTAARPGGPTAGMFRYNSTLNAIEVWNGTIWQGPGVNPTVQTFTSGTAATYTPTTGMVRIRVRMCGGGGGGGAATFSTGANNGTAGNDSSFESWTAKGGGGGSAGTGGGGAGGGAGGTGGADGTGTKIVRITGGAGNSAYGAANFLSGAGGSNPFGGGGRCSVSGSVGANAAANTGGGGSGGANGASGVGGGGGSGEYVEFWMTAAQVGASKTYTVGAAANGGTAGGQAGGNGAAGIIIIEEFYC